MQFAADFFLIFFLFCLFPAPHYLGSPREAGFGSTFRESMEEVQNTRAHPTRSLFHLIFTGIFIGHGILLNVRLYATALYLKNRFVQDKDMSLNTLYLKGFF